MSTEEEEGLCLYPDPNVMDLNEVSAFLGISRPQIVNLIKICGFPLPRSVKVAVWERSEIEAMKNG